MKLSQTNGPILHFYDGDEYSSFLHLKNAGFKYVDISFWSRYNAGSRYFTTDNDVLADEYKRILDKLELIPVQSHEPFGNSMGEDGGAFYFKKTPLSIPKYLLFKILYSIFCVIVVLLFFKIR